MASARRRMAFNLAILIYSSFSKTSGNKSNYSKPEYFYNRELSWISFNYRVLEEAQDKDIPKILLFLKGFRPV